MSLNIEWKERIDRWCTELLQQFYTPLADLALEGFVTGERLTAAQARRGPFKPMPVGANWGGKWQYGWFRARVTVPRSAAGERIVIHLGQGGEGLVFLDGQPLNGVSNSVREQTLTRKAVGGERFEVLCEAYAGHGPTPCSIGPIPPGRASVPEPPAAQRQVGPSSFGIWNEEIYQLHIDVQTLLHLRNSLDAASLRVAEIDQGLRDFSTIVNFECEREDMMRTIRAARRRLRPLLECRNGSTAPTMFAFGHSHLDVAWLWPLAETERKAVRTLANQIRLIEEYPSYKFLHSQAHLFWMVKTLYPEFYQKVRKYARAGRIVPDGGMWVEADTNIAGGEALIRQFIHGKRFFMEEFGFDSHMMWLPDVFGYSGAIPQILAGCDIQYFATAKIFWNYHGGETFPHNTFWWEGIDGSQVLVHLMNDYNSQMTPSAVCQRWNERVQKDGISTRLMPFGWGDGGGGPTRDHLEYVTRQGDLEGAPRVKIAPPEEYFRDQLARGVPNIRYVGEIYYQCHRGTYTSQAKTKKGNRKSELALREAELWLSAAGALAGLRIPDDRLETVWRKLLLNQFHDILPGSSIARVYQEAEAAFADVVAQAHDMATAAQGKLVRKADALTVFNSLNWPRKELVELPAAFRGRAADVRGNALETQKVGGKTYAEVTVPSCGWTTVRPSEAQASPAGADVIATPRLLENEFLRVKFNARGEIVSLFDKQASRELAAGACNSMKMYRDNPSQFDAWDIDSMYPLTPVALDKPATIEVVAAGALAGSLRIQRKINRSDLVQTVTLRRGSRRLDFSTTVEWRESHKLLKVAFPVDMHANEAIHEIQFGHLRRPNHASRQFDADRYEVSNHKWSALAEETRGVAILNDCKYGLNVVGNTINLTLLRSPMAPDQNADHGHQEFVYALYAWNGSLADSGVVRQGYELNCPLTTHDGDGGEASLLEVDAPNIVIEAVKPAEDRSGDVIVRLYESLRSACRCTLTTSLPVAAARKTNMLEQPQGTLAVRGRRIGLDFRPFEIKTLRLKMT